ncbi:hypothetical protein BC835DRAFT_477109 [Cytidiella melzeri]|nr:hypothetical protein BC835DRAFT_477109 [Cytidiella melzeri]
MPRDTLLVVDSRSARREFTQCQKCGKDKEQFKIKLSVCTGCHIATYAQSPLLQSSTCQRAHWPTHKQMCMQRRKGEKACADMDRAATNPHPLNRPVPSEIVSELRSFTQKFNAAIFQAGISYLHIRSDSPDLWRETVLMVVLRRLPDTQEHSRPWSRYAVDVIMPVEMQHVVEKIAGGDRSILQRKTEQENQHRARGCTGTITAMIATPCEATEPPRLIHNVTFYGFGPHSFSMVEVSEDWQEEFKENVEKMCGRTASTSI